jgi:hypothetical protein
LARDGLPVFVGSFRVVLAGEGPRGGVENELDPIGPIAKGGELVFSLGTGGGFLLERPQDFD